MLGIREAAGITIFRQNCYVSEYRIISSRNPSVLQKVSGIAKIYALEENITIFYRKFVVSQYRETSRGKHCVSQNFSYRKMLGIREGAGITIFPQFLSHSTESFRTGTLVYFRKFRVSKNFMLERVMSRFSVELFCLAVPKNFIGQPFCSMFQKISGSEKVHDKRGGGGGYQDLPTNIFCLIVPKIS